MVSNEDTGYDYWLEDIKSVESSIRDRRNGVSVAAAYSDLERHKGGSGMDDLEELESDHDPGDDSTLDDEVQGQKAEDTLTNSASTNAPATEGKPSVTGRVVQKWDAKETLECWDLYWEQDGKPKQGWVGKVQREQVFNAWRRTNGYKGHDRT